jgi:hypothetical protein
VDHLVAKKPIVHSSERKTRNDSGGLRSRRKSGESEQSFATSDDNIKRRLMASDDERYNEEERMLDIAEQCFMRIADLLHL